MDNLKPYSNYKDSGFFWLGNIPIHWKLERLDRLFNLRNETPLATDERVTAYLDGRVTFRSNVGQKIKGVIKEAGWQRIHEGDFAISGMNAHIGGMGVSDSTGKCSPIYLVLEPKPNTNAFFISRCVRYLAQIGLLKSLVNTIRFNSADFKRDDLKKFWVWIPTYEEQADISIYIKHMENLTRRYIQSKQQQIRMLNSQKQTIIQNAVLGRLDKPVRRKPSNIQWVEEVPEHWDIISNRRLFRENTRMERDGTELRFSLSQRDGLIVTSEMKERSLIAATHENFKVCLPGDLILNRFKAHLGVFFAAWARGIVTYHYGVFEPLVELRTKYFEYLFHTMPYRTIYAGASNGMTVGLQNLSNQNFYKIKSILPPLDEQDQILAYIEEHTSTINAAQKVIQEQINAVKEYHSRLISDVVTGKIDVRDAAKNLPEIETLEPAESELSEEDELSDEMEVAEELSNADE